MKSSEINFRRNLKQLVLADKNLVSCFAICFGFEKEIAIAGQTFERKIFRLTSVSNCSITTCENSGGVRFQTSKFN